MPPKTKPQDHLPPKGTPKLITIRGVELSVDPEMFDDLDLLDTLDQVNEGNGLRLAGGLRRVTGDKFSKVREALRDPETGRIPLEVAGEFFIEVMESIVPNS